MRYGAWFLGLMIALSVVSATNVSMNIYSNEGIDIHANPNTPGTTNYYLDGANYKETIKDIKDDEMDEKGVYRTLYEAFMEYDPFEKSWEIVKFEELDYFAQRFRFVMENYFVTFREYRELKQENLKLRLEVEALQQFHSDEQMCNARIMVANKRGINKVSCGNTTHYLDKNISIKTGGN